MLVVGPPEVVAGVTSVVIAVIVVIVEYVVLGPVVGVVLATSN